MWYADTNDSTKNFLYLQGTPQPEVYLAYQFKRCHNQQETAVKSSDVNYASSRSSSKQ
jgi:hypothetical protein